MGRADASCEQPPWPPAPSPPGSGTIRAALIFAALLLAVAASWWLGRLHDPAPADPRVERPDAPAGYYLRGARLYGTDEQGHIIYTVSASDARREQEDDPILLADVEIRYTPAAEVPWRLSSDQAAVSPDLTLLTLTGNVVAVSDQGPIVVRTPALTLDTARHVAETRERVEVELPEGRLESVGMTAWLKDERLQLESQVHGTFLP